MFCSNFTIKDTSLKHVRGEDKLSRWAQNKTIATGATMEDSFCSVCGNLMYRREQQVPGYFFFFLSILRIGTVDDFNLHASKLKPQFEQFTDSRVSWFGGVQIEGIPHYPSGGVLDCPSNWGDTGLALADRAKAVNEPKLSLRAPGCDQFYWWSTVPWANERNCCRLGITSSTAHIGSCEQGQDCSQTRMFMVKVRVIQTIS